MRRGLAMDTSHGERPGWEAEDHGPVYRKIAWPRPATARRGLHGLGAMCADGDPPDSDIGCAAGGGVMMPGGGIWGSIIPAGLNIGQQITRSLFPIPTYQQQSGPRGSSVTVYGQPQGANALMVGPTSIPGWVWLAAAAAVAVALASRSR
jgi:hypothetical protein